MNCQLHYDEWETKSLFIYADWKVLEHLRHHVSYSGASDKYVASFFFELPKVLHVLGWKHPHLSHKNGQWVLRNHEE